MELSNGVRFFFVNIEARRCWYSLRPCKGHAVAITEPRRHSIRDIDRTRREGQVSLLCTIVNPSPSYPTPTTRS